MLDFKRLRRLAHEPVPEFLKAATIALANLAEKLNRVELPNVND